MAISYKKLFHLLVDRGMKDVDLRKAARHIGANNGEATKRPNSSNGHH